MDEVAHSVEEVKAYEDLLGHDSGDVHGDSFVVVAFYDVKKVYSHNLENHTKMISIRTSVDERIY